MTTLKRYALLLILLGGINAVNAQSLLDISMGTSKQDDIATQLTFRHQFSPRFRAGVQIQYGTPNYRFVSARPFEDNGYSTTFSVPLTYRLYEANKIQLHAFLNPGLRFQGIIDPDENNAMDSIFSSRAIAVETGFLVNIATTEKLNFQSGISFPVLYEISPITLFENQATLIHAGLSYQFSNSLLFFKSNMGTAFGASGDSQKFLWSAQTGVRFVLGKKKSNYSPSIIEASL